MCAIKLENIRHEILVSLHINTLIPDNVLSISTTKSICGTSENVNSGKSVSMLDNSVKSLRLRYYRASLIKSFLLTLNIQIPLANKPFLAIFFRENSYRI